MVIKNKKKFVRAILLIIGISVLINLILVSKAFSHAELKYKTISVSSGDTLWDIAKAEQTSNTYYKNKDIRDVIEDIKEINNLKNCNLNLGQTLEIATY